MCRGRSSSRSKYTRSSPNDDSASERAMATALCELVGGAHDPHPLPPPPATAFTSSGYPMPSEVGVAARQRTGTPGRRPRCIAARCVLLPIVRIAPGVGPMNVKPGLRACLGELRVLGQKPVARMHRVGAGRSGDVDQLVDPQVAFRCLVRPDGVRFVRQAHVKRVAIAFRIHRNRGEPHVAARPDDPHGNLAAVGDEYLFQVGRTGGSASVIVSSGEHLGERHWSAKPRSLPALTPSPSPAQRGMLPCFFGGFFSRLVVSVASARISFLRVVRGWMISSTNPRAAATNGLANFSRNSATRLARSAAGSFAASSSFL